MIRILLTIIALTFSILINAQTIFGEWKNPDDVTGKVNSIIKVYEKNNKAYAKIIEITETIRRDDLCTKCTGENKNRPILGMDILSGLVKKKNSWTDGKIIDPKRGGTYDCTIELVTENKLKVRGYIGIPMLGKTVYWIRN